MLQFLPLIGTVIDKIFPDAQASAEAKIKLAELQANGDLKELEATIQRDVEQIALNKIEAESSSKFKSWWRPAIGWICVFGFGYVAVVQPIAEWVCLNVGMQPPPTIAGDLLMSVMFGMLGLGGMRSFEKFKGLTK